MNVFVLAAAVCDAAELHNDAHVVKMPQEGVQILSPALRLLGNTLQGAEGFQPAASLGALGSIACTCATSTI